jgi:hypothetical protein
MDRSLRSRTDAALHLAGRILTLPLPASMMP